MNYRILPTSYLHLLLLTLTLLLSACDGFFGKKTDIDFLEEPQYDDRPVAYVPVYPVLSGFIRPVDVIAGWDELIYVADAGSEEIVSFDEAGNELGRFRVQGLKAIAQDRRLDLLALGTRDTVIGTQPYRLPAIYRISLKGTGGYGLAQARVTRVITHPFYFRSGTPTSNDVAASFEGIAVLGDNRYYVARNGVSQAINQFGGPDDAILLFDANDTYLTPVQVATSLGVFNNYFRKPKGIATEIAPPQDPSISTTDADFIFTSREPGNPFGVQVIQYIETDGGASYSVRPFINDTSKATSFLYETSRFKSPTDVWFTGVGLNYYLVVDAEADSLYVFTNKGYEGVNPPPGSSNKKNIVVSFGGKGSGPTQFNEPSGVAYLNRRVYVADAGNGRVLRFQLTTDFE